MCEKMASGSGGAHWVFSSPKAQMNHPWVSKGWRLISQKEKVWGFAKVW